MSLKELLPILQKLERADKLRAVQFLVFELAKEEGIALLAPGAAYPVWTPYHAVGAADSLLGMLSAPQEPNRG